MPAISVALVTVWVLVFRTSGATLSFWLSPTPMVTNLSKSLSKPRYISAKYASLLTFRKVENQYSATSPSRRLTWRRGFWSSVFLLQ